MSNESKSSNRLFSVPLLSAIGIGVALGILSPIILIATFLYLMYSDTLLSIIALVAVVVVFLVLRHLDWHDPGYILMLAFMDAINVFTSLIKSKITFLAPSSRSLSEFHSLIQRNDNLRLAGARFILMLTTSIAFTHILMEYLQH